LARGKYVGFNDSHLRDKLEREEGLTLSRSTVRSILRDAGLSSPQKRRSAKYRKRRAWRLQEGMLLLVDGSEHDWLERPGPRLTLIGFAEDATGKVPAARFQTEHEDSAGYLRLIRAMASLQRNDDHWSSEEQLAASSCPRRSAARSGSWGLNPSRLARREPRAGSSACALCRTRYRISAIGRSRGSEEWRHRARPPAP
jgi:hypothetical protein